MKSKEDVQRACKSLASIAHDIATVLDAISEGIIPVESLAKPNNTPTDSVPTESAPAETEKPEREETVIEKPAETTPRVEQPEQKPTKGEKMTASFDPEQIDSMTYAEIKSLAKDLGVSASGTRAKIVERILAVDLNVDKDGEIEVATEAEKPISDITVEAAIEEPDEPEDATYKEVIEATADLSTEELGEILSEVGITPRGKREALIDLIYNAVVEGKLSLDEGAEDEGEQPDRSEIITPEREKAIEEMTAETEQGVKDGDISRDDLIAFLVDYFGTKAEDYKDSDMESLVRQYISAARAFIDDEGNTIEEEGVPYLVNGESYCCGAPLKYSAETNRYVCEICGTEYEDEDDE